ncbi:MAG TPA: hypothetical protein VK993_16625 [Chthoniobacterales bacterium]|nr:hypothetical protein [Chthoniobacterales bacterium]
MFAPAGGGISIGPSITRAMFTKPPTRMPTMTAMTLQRSVFIVG